jgi:primosomal protein N' (replication factor Y)
MLKKELKENVFGPFIPPVTRVQNLYIRQILLKIDLSIPILDMRSILDQARQHMQTFPQFRQVLLHYDVEN